MCKLPCDIQLVRDLLLGGPVQAKSGTDLTDQQLHGEMLELKGEGIGMCVMTVISVLRVHIVLVSRRVVCTVLHALVPYLACDLCHI